MASTYKSNFGIKAALYNSQARVNMLQTRLMQIQRERSALMEQISHVSQMENYQKEINKAILISIFPNGMQWNSLSTFGLGAGVPGFGNSGGNIFASGFGSAGLGNSGENIFGSSSGISNFGGDMFSLGGIGSLATDLIGGNNPFGSLAGSGNLFGGNSLSGLLRADSFPWSLTNIGTSTGNLCNNQAYKDFLHIREQDLELEQQNTQNQLAAEQKNLDALSKAVEDSAMTPACLIKA